MPARLFAHVLAVAAVLTLVVCGAANAQDFKVRDKETRDFVPGRGEGGHKKPSGDSAFAKSSIDIGLVVGDVEKSLDFYKNTLGLKELAGFDVPENVGTDAGLIDHEGLHVHVLALSDDPDAAKLKLLSFKKNKSDNGEKKFIHSELGFRYVTISVRDGDAAVARLKEHHAKLLGKSPVALPDNVGKGMYLIVLRDPDSNVIELVGPHK